MTAVFKVERPGPIQNVQVGPQDIVAVVSALSSAWGWTGGLRGIWAILQYGRDQFGLRSQSSVFSPPALSPAACQFLTFDGLATFQNRAAESFEGDYTTQMVGFTLCALAHELKLFDAIQLFMNYLAPTRFRLLFDECTGSREALHTQLVDNGQVILNEGAALGLPEKFDQACKNIGFSNAREESSSAVNSHNWKSDRYMIGGLLRWIGRGCPEPYYTRSVIVVRIAAYLRDVGYAIGIIRKWDGQGQRPNGSRAVVLVIGGSSDTDTYMDTDPGLPSFPKMAIISHYKSVTVGAMLLNTLQGPCALHPEVVQQGYEDIEKDISQRLEFQWMYVKVESPAEGYENEIRAFPKWKARETASRIALRLSSFYFPRAAEFVAPYYNGISQPETLEIVKQQLDRDDRTVFCEKSLIEFRLCTVSILIAIVSQLGGPDFNNLRHATMISLQWPRSIKNFAHEVETMISSSLSFPRVSHLLAHVHCGKEAPPNPDSMSEEDIQYNETGIVGWRHGSYAVLPAILSHMASGPSKSALGFHCFDTFIGNVPVQKDGSVRSIKHGIHPSDFRDHEPLRSLLADQKREDCELQIGKIDGKVSLGPAVLSNPDVPLYLNIERPPDREHPVLGLCGRVNGESIGNVGFFAIMRTILQSFDEHDDYQQQKSVLCARRCDQSTLFPPLRFFVVPSSTWCKQSRRPTGEPHYHAYVPVQNDAAWAIFLAGETESRLCLCCANCAIRSIKGIADGEKITLIGYEG